MTSPPDLSVKSLDKVVNDDNKSIKNDVPEAEEDKEDNETHSKDDKEHENTYTDSANKDLGQGGAPKDHDADVEMSDPDEKDNEEKPTAADTPMATKIEQKEESGLYPNIAEADHEDLGAGPQKPTSSPQKTAANTPMEKRSTSQLHDGSEEENDSSFLAISQSIRRSQKASADNSRVDESFKRVSIASFHSANEEFNKSQNTPAEKKQSVVEPVEAVEEGKETDAKQEVGNYDGLASGEDNDDDGSDSDDDDARTVNRSTLGFAGLPAREPLTKKSFAKTPSSTLSQSARNKPFASISRMKNHPTSFESKMDGAAGNSSESIQEHEWLSTKLENTGSKDKENDEGSNGNPAYPVLDESSRLSVHYPEISKPSVVNSEPKDQEEQHVSTSTTMNSAKSLTSSPSKSGLPVHHSSSIRKDPEQQSKTEPSSPAKLPSKAPSSKQASPVRNASVNKSTTSTRGRSPPPASSPLKITVSPIRKEQNNPPKNPAPSQSSPLKRAAESPRIERLVNTSDNNQAAYSPGGSLMSLTAGVFRRAKQLLFDQEGDQKMENINESENRRPVTATKPAAMSRLMAPTASSSRHATSPSKDTNDYDSPLAEKKPGYIKSLYPDVPQRVASQNKANIQPTKTGNDASSSSNDPFNDDTSSSSKSTASRNKGVKSTSSKETLKSQQSSVSENKEQPSTANEVKESTNTKQGSNKLTKQALQYKKPPTTTSQSAKPVTIKVATSSQKEIEQQQKKKAQAQAQAQQQKQQPQQPSQIKTTSVNAGANSSLTQKSLSVTKPAGKPTPGGSTGLRKKEDEPTKSKQQGLSTATSKQDLNKPAVITAATKKRTSDQAFDAPTSNKAPRISSKTQPLKKPSQGNLMKTAMIQQAKANTPGPAGSGSVPQVEGVKFSNDKIRFAPNPSASTSQQPQRTIPTPQAKANIFRQMPTVSTQQAQSYSTPKPQESMELPEIMSESEDDDDGNVLKDWASTPELRNMLMNQQKVDPDAIFGPIPPLHMEEVFKNSRLSRFRPRSSSANWTGQDKLSQQEIERYAAQMGYKKD
ncbi:hypothetical protein TRICI_005103 [Trichomonascus ciferrii]|uniref:Inner centromere protein ARK-binding domain-containing protein n=1 Tax=Trichomonascus ciferrii TaxID=44093 RepID=A0A642UW68_9ASCO|nr:hypothetical protein TRICI_005103 [Trichomonascus ciferrii]